MNQDYWQRQTDKPLFPELEWSRPENKNQAGKLLIVGGNSQGFAAPAESFGYAEKAGIGTVRVVLPDSLRKSVGKLFPPAEFVPSTPSGSFGTSALAELCDASIWADGVLFPGDISRNSETTALLENFLERHTGQVTLTRDAADLLCQQPISILHRPDTLVVLSQGQLQKLATSAHFPRAFTADMGLFKLVDALHEFTKRYMTHIITKYQGNYVVAVTGNVTTTPIPDNQPIWRLVTSSYCSVWWLQNSLKPLEALTTAVRR